MAHTHRQTTEGHCNLETKLVQRADSVKVRIWKLLYGSEMDHSIPQTVLSFCLWDRDAVGLDITLLAFNKVVIL